MAIAVGLGVYLALATLFYARLTATATDGAILPVHKPSHRARRRVGELVRRVRAARKR